MSTPDHEPTDPEEYSGLGWDVWSLVPGTYNDLGEYTHWGFAAQAMREWGQQRVVILGVENHATFGDPAELPEQVGSLLMRSWDAASQYDFSQLAQVDQLGEYRERGAHRPPTLFGTELPSRDTVLEWMEMGRGVENPSVGWPPGPPATAPLRLPDPSNPAPEGELYVTFVDVDLTSPEGGMNIGVIGPKELIYKHLVRPEPILSPYATPAAE